MPLNWFLDIMKTNLKGRCLHVANVSTFIRSHFVEVRGIQYMESHLNVMYIFTVKIGKKKKRGNEPVTCHNLADDLRGKDWFKAVLNSTYTNMVSFQTFSHFADTQMQITQRNLKVMYAATTSHHSRPGWMYSTWLQKGFSMKLSMFSINYLVTRVPFKCRNEPVETAECASFPAPVCWVI